MSYAQVRLCDTADNQILGVLSVTGEVKYFNWPSLTAYTLNLTPYRECYGHEIHIKAGEDIGDAVDALPKEGGKIVLGYGYFESPWMDQDSANTRDNVQIIGCQKPVFSADNKSLVAGSVIRGSFWQGGNGRSFSNVGIDVGEDFVTSDFGGAAQEGLIFRDTAYLGDPIDEWQGLHLSNYIVLSHQHDSDVHAVLIENYRGFTQLDWETMYGGAGTVVKSRRGVSRGVRAHRHIKYSVLNKSENYQSASENAFGQMYFYGGDDLKPDVSSYANFEGNGFVVEAANADAFNIVADGIYTFGCVNAAKVYTQGDHKCIDVKIGNVHSSHCHNAPVEVSGNCEDVTISVGSFKESRIGLSVGSDCLRTCFDGVTISESGTFGIDNAGVGTEFINSHIQEVGIAGARGTAGDITLCGTSFCSFGAQPKTLQSGGVVNDI